MYRIACPRHSSNQTRGEEVGIEHLTEERAHALALRVMRTPGYRVVEVRRAWSAMWAWHVEVHEHRTGERVLLLSEDQFDARLIEVRPPKLGENHHNPDNSPCSPHKSARPPHPLASRAQVHALHARPGF